MKQVRNCVLVMLALLVAAAPSPGLQDTGGVRISGWALSFGTIGTGANQTIDITITRWSPMALRDNLLKTMVEKGQNGVLNLLRSR